MDDVQSATNDSGHPALSSARLQTGRPLREGEFHRLARRTRAVPSSVATSIVSPSTNDLTKAVRAHSATEHTRLNTVTMKQQWVCHAIGKAAIGIGTWLGYDGNPTWDLETHRRALSGDIWKSGKTMVTKNCNW